MINKEQNRECCFGCINFNVDGLTDGLRGKITPEEYKPCEFYPEKLPKGADMLQVYKCDEHFELASPEELLKRMRKSMSEVLPLLFLLGLGGKNDFS